MHFNTSQPTARILLMYRMFSSLSHEQMAKKVGLKLGKYLKLESGTEAPSSELIFKLSKVLGFPENDFIENEYTNKHITDEMIKKMKKYREFIKLLDENPEIGKAVLKFSNNQKMYKNIKLKKIMRRIIKILTDKDKSHMFFEILELCGR